MDFFTITAIAEKHGQTLGNPFTEKAINLDAAKKKARNLQKKAYRKRPDIDWTVVVINLATSRLEHKLEPSAELKGEDPEPAPAWVIEDIQERSTEELEHGLDTLQKMARIGLPAPALEKAESIMAEILAELTHREG